eukprot:m.104711 g.104711  ORF g.104711 m.104711 type:complete len:480 (+) comp12642_c0_seq4:27-1466(+)
MKKRKGYVEVDGADDDPDGQKEGLEEQQQQQQHYQQEFQEESGFQGDRNAVSSSPDSIRPLLQMGINADEMIHTDDDNGDYYGYNHSTSLYNEEDDNITGDENALIERNMNVDHPKSRRNWIAFWILGLCNNFGYVIMLSGAHDILKKLDPKLGTAAVLLADILPTLLIKLVGGPLLVYRMPYTLRIAIVVAFAILSFVLVGVAGSVSVALFGVVCASISSGLGEISFLSMTSCYNKNVINAWSSGTGGAGAIGASVYLAITEVLSPQRAQFAMLFVPILMIIAYAGILTHRPVSIVSTDLKKKDPFTTKEKLAMAKRLIIPYMLPLFLVYWAEYAINQSLYENLKFPNYKKLNTDQQYRMYQLIYQIGVFVSRSSRTIFSLNSIWWIAFLQIANFIVLFCDARFHFLHSIYIIFVWIFYEGLLGGLVYVNAFALISKNTKPDHREFSMTVASVGDTFGISLAGACGLAINKYLQRYNH